MIDLFFFVLFFFLLMLTSGSADMVSIAIATVAVPMGRRGGQVLVVLKRGGGVAGCWI